MVMALFVALTPEVLYFGGIEPLNAWQVGVFIGLPTAAMFVFKNACKLRIWRTYSQEMHSPRTGRWIKDLPSVLAIDFFKDILIFINFLTAVFGLYLILSINSTSGVFYIAVAMLLTAIVKVLYPSVLAKRLWDSASILTAMTESWSHILRHPWRILAVRILPGFIRFLLLCLMVCSIVYSGINGLLTQIAACILVVLTIAMEPVLWLGVIKNR